MTEIDVPDWVVEAGAKAILAIANPKCVGELAAYQFAEDAITAALGAWVVHEGWKYEGLYPNVPPFRKDRADGYTAPLYTLRQEKPE